MATRFYPMPNSVADITPSFSAGWNVTSSAVRRFLLTSKSDNASVNPNLAGTGAANQNRLHRQLITRPLAPQVLSGTLKGQMRALETNTTDDYMVQMRCFVVSNDGGTVRGIAYELHTNALSSEFATALTNRRFPLAALSTTLTSVALLAGDRIVIEIGHRQTSTSAANAQFNSRDNGAGDLPENETETGADNSWFEFSQNIISIGGVAGGFLGGMGMGLGIGV